ncbi:MAG: hypothetical protein V4592_03605 [Bacteroidota bacterium]
MKKIFLFALMLAICACHKTTSDNTNKIDTAKTIIGKWLVTGRVVVFYTAGKEVARLNITVSQDAPPNSSTLTVPYYYQFNTGGLMGVYAYDTRTGKYILDPNISAYALTNENKTLNTFTGQVAFVNYDISLSDNNTLTLVDTRKLVAYLAADNTVKVADNDITTTSYTRMQ